MFYTKDLILKIKKEQERKKELKNTIFLIDIKAKKNVKEGKFLTVDNKNLRIKNKKDIFKIPLNQIKNISLLIYNNQD